MNCFSIVEENILVSEVGFAEGSGGRMHVQGTFVSHGASKLACCVCGITADGQLVSEAEGMRDLTMSRSWVRQPNVET